MSCSNCEIIPMANIKTTLENATNVGDKLKWNKQKH